MKLLTIECDGIGDASAIGGQLKLELQGVDVSFIEDMEAKDIVMWADNKELLEEMDEDEVLEWVRNKFDIIIKENR